VDDEAPAQRRNPSATLEVVKGQANDLAAGSDEISQVLLAEVQTNRGAATVSFPVALGEFEKLFRKSCGDSVKHLRFETLFEPRATLSEKPGDADSE
jgi:hypothetical protein